jgi:hypothetical protein
LISPQVPEIREILKESLTIILEFPELEDLSHRLATILNEARQPEANGSLKLEMTSLLGTCVHEIEQIVQAATEEMRAMQEAEDKRADRIVQLKLAATELQQISESVIAQWSSPGTLGDTELRVAMLSFSPIRLPGDPSHIFWEESLFSARWAEIEKSLQLIPRSVVHSRDNAQQKMLEILKVASSRAAKNGVILPCLNIEPFPSPQRYIDQSVEFYRAGSWWQFWRHEAREKRTPNLEKAKDEIRRYVHEMSRTLLDHLHRWAREVHETWVKPVLLEVDELVDLSRTQRRKISAAEDEIARRSAALQRLETLLCIGAEIPLR